ncbi:tRNA lysidine(34) synthetase TilS [Amycolatopsis antarctica]|uniref:tRNA(Ile)-lysidine synthase n=1 Tax=Amycolatopsis antarctica TaxID=1854586 RepID=A0A263CZR2_9PSEU|nr:tRNA lysidine(34) synthetase TilS [Amycolatopsis antarctica]OZM70887.1 tRNA lysidine(34) synthetase TilS [Amycolatopsis antarctica]
MSGKPHPALARVRRAVREFLRSVPPGDLYVAVSGGADSLALAEGCVHAGARTGVKVTALIVDHGLQDGSAEVATTAAATARELGVHEARVLTVRVSGSGGPEAAARRARYAALRAELPEGGLLLLGHTRDDQAETVLLGLGRGSGPRSLAGMPAFEPPLARPLLDVPREVTVRACAALGVTPWQDPHNADRRFTRVRLRTEVLPLLDEVLAGGVPAALARTAAQLREDSAALDVLAAELLAEARDGQGELDVAVLGPAPAALRRRVLRRWLLDAGVRELTDAHLRSVDAFMGEWRGQGGTWLPGDLVAFRAHGRLTVNPLDRSKGD